MPATASRITGASALAWLILIALLVVPLTYGNAIGILAMIGVNPALIAIILGVDRILDMCRTTLNVVGDITAATYVARSEGFELLKTPENAGIG